MNELDLESNTKICFGCEIQKYPFEKNLDRWFFMERKNEFYPEEEFGAFVKLCDRCHEDLIENYLSK